jgi:L-ascorbate metabolism protein UlaG (beta-lactamase superfamily)
MSPLHDTKITYLGHSTILIETPGGKRILIDPWTTGNPTCPDEFKSPENLGALDMILVTHAHGDHISDLALVATAHPNAHIVAIYDLGAYISLYVPEATERFLGMNKGGTQNLAGIGITMTHAFHSSSFTDKSGNLVYAGEPAGYILELEDGFTLYAAGDTALFGDMALIKELYHPDLAFLPIGDHFTMGPKEAACAVRLLGVTHVVPIHYATFPVLTGTPEALREHLGDLAVTIHALESGGALTLSRD